MSSTASLKHNVMTHHTTGSRTSVASDAPMHTTKAGKGHLRNFSHPGCDYRPLRPTRHPSDPSDLHQRFGSRSQPIAPLAISPKMNTSAKKTTLFCFDGYTRETTKWDCLRRVSDANSSSTCCSDHHCDYRIRNCITKMQNAPSTFMRLEDRSAVLL